MKSCISCGCQLTTDNTKPYRLKNYIHKCNQCDREEKMIQARRSRILDRSKTNDASFRHKEKMKIESPIKYTCSQMLSSSRKRAKFYSWDNDLTTDYLISIAPTHCPVLICELKYGGGEKSRNSASLDRINSCLGYTVGNVQIISNAANLMKSDASSVEMVLFAKWAMETFS